MFQFSKTEAVHGKSQPGHSLPPPVLPGAVPPAHPPEPSRVSRKAGAGDRHNLPLRGGCEPWVKTPAQPVLNIGDSEIKRAPGSTLYNRIQGQNCPQKTGQTQDISKEEH